MKRIVEYFDRSYIINLKDRVDRRREVEHEFRRLGISIPNEKVQFYTATRPTDQANFASIGVRGCFMSHLNVLDFAQRDNLRNVLVFEDDVSFRNVEVDFEERLIENLSHADWDLLWLGYSRPAQDGLSGPLTRWTGDIICAHCYAVNGRFIRTMAQYMWDCEQRPRDHPESGPMTADGAYNHIRYISPDVVLLLCVPSLAFQRSSRSNLAPNPSTGAPGSVPLSHVRERSKINCPEILTS
jgi:glycosyl transferase family 25